MPYLELQDCNLHYRIDDHSDAWTSPQTVLFVHGFTENCEAWRAWVPHFSRRYRMVRIDQRGFGKSGPLAKDFPLTTEIYVDDLARVLAAHGDSAGHQFRPLRARPRARRPADPPGRRTARA